MALSARLNESRRYARISALVLAGLGPPRSQRAGGFSPPICLAQASLAQATCFTCSAKVRTPLNSPCAGLKLHLSSGMASASDVKSCSTLFQIKLMESGTVFGGSGRCWPMAMAEPTRKTLETKRRCSFFMTLLEMIHRESLEIIADQRKNEEQNENCAISSKYVFCNRPKRA